MTNPQDLLSRFMRESGYPVPTSPRAVAPLPPRIETPPAAIIVPEIVERVREPTDAEVFQRFVEMAKADPLHLQRLAHVFNYAKPFHRASSAKPFPIKALITLEAAIAPAKPSKAKRQRADQGPHPFTMSLQAQTPKSNTVSDPMWKGRAYLGTPDRIERDADRQAKQKSISQPHREFIGEMVELARDNGYLLGMVRSESDGDGSPYCGMTIVMVGREEVEAFDLNTAAAILHREGDATAMIRLPAFDTRTSRGNPLSGGYRLQCRASRSADLRGDWSTGLFEFMGS